MTRWFCIRCATFCTLSLLLLQLVTCRLHCPRQQHFASHVNKNKIRFHNCRIHVRKNSNGAGEVRNVTGKCLYNATSMDNFRYLISWDAPVPTDEKVTGYQVHIRHRHTHKYACFQVPSTHRSMIFNQSVGFIAGCAFFVAVTPQPISADVDIYQAEMTPFYGCPIAPHLLPLNNVLVSRGSMFSFHANFDQAPIPKPRVRWFFSSDERQCRNRRAVQMDQNSIILSDDGLTLQVHNAQEKHIGCYVVTAHNGFGRVAEQRGYLRLNETLAMSSRTMEDHFADVHGRILITLIAGFIIFFILFVMVIVLFRRQRYQPASVPVEVFLRKQVYISHNIHLKKEVNSLATLASLLQSNGIDVVVDIFNQVQINNVGGWSRWIPTKMEKADKILLILTPNYLSALKELSRVEPTLWTPCITENMQKVHTEFNHVNNILLNELHDAKSVVLVTKGVSRVDIPRVLTNVQSIEFPVKFDREKDVNFSTLVNRLLE